MKKCCLTWWVSTSWKGTTGLTFNFLLCKFFLRTQIKMVRHNINSGLVFKLMEMIKHRLSDFLSWYFLKSDNTPPSNFSVSDRKLSPPIRLFNSWLFKLQTQSHRRVCFRSSNSYLFLSFEPQGPLPSCLRRKIKDDGTKVVLWEQSKLCRLKELNYNILGIFDYELN